MTGAIGLLGTRPSYELMRGCDTLLTVGSSFPYTQFLPDFGQARAVQIDLDGRYIGMRYPYEVNLAGDAAATLRALIPRLRRKPDRSWRETVEGNVARWWEVMAAEAMVDADPVNPMRLFHELSHRLPDDVIVTADSGSSANWYARQLKFRGDMRGSLSGNLATMGPGRPLRHRGQVRPSGPAGDRVRGRRGHADERAGRADHDQALLASNGPIRGWSSRCCTTTTSTRSPGRCGPWKARPKFTESQWLPDVDYAAFAASLGLQAIAVDKPDQIGPAWDRALAADRPTVLDVRTDPNVPPIPPHATFEQAKDAAQAMLKGDADRRGVVVEGVKTKVQEFLPHRES